MDTTITYNASARSLKVAAAALAIGMIATAIWAMLPEGDSESGPPATPDGPLAEVAAKRRSIKLAPLAKEMRFDGKAAYKHLVALCDLGARPSGSPGMAKQQQLLMEFFGQPYFQQRGAKVSLQKFSTKRHPHTGQLVPMANMIVELNPQAKNRVLFCAHYDTRPLPDRDPDAWQRQHGVFLGANDGASGVALLMELATKLPEPRTMGIDLVFFDAEEFVYNEQRDNFFLGSTHFAQQYQEHPPAHRYQYGVLVDMIGDAKLGIRQEPHSMMWSDTHPLVMEIWTVARELRVREFIWRPHSIPIRDDHLPLNRIAHIPVIDIIDFAYPDTRHGYWHTMADNPKNCSAESLYKVGWVLQEWLRTKSL